MAVPFSWMISGIHLFLSNCKTDAAGSEGYGAIFGPH